MNNFDDIDKLIKPAVSWVRAQESLTGSRFKKAFPAKKQNFTATKYVSLNPDYPQVNKIMKLLKNKDFAGAEAEAGGNKLLLDAVAHYQNAMVGLNRNLTNSMADAPLYIRQIKGGKRGRNKDVSILMGYSSKGEDIIAKVPKKMLYVIDGRKLRGQIENMVPKPPTKAHIVPTPVASPTDEAKEVVWDVKRPRGVIFKNGQYIKLDGVGNDDYILTCSAEGPHCKHDAIKGFIDGKGNCGDAECLVSSTSPPAEDLPPEDLDNKVIDNPESPSNELISSISPNADMSSVEIPPSDPNGSPVGSSKPPSKNDRLRRLIGNKVVSALEQLGVRDNITMEDVSVNGVAIYNGRNGGAIRADLLNNSIVEDTVRFKGLISDSSFGKIDAPDDMRPFRPDDMGAVLLRIFQPKLLFAEQRRGRESALSNLRTIRKHMASLSTVFGFDDPEQLEAFFSAWLMKDSTIRLTGIPGTGKTTVINSAATLLCNSYGFDNAVRYLARSNVSNGEFHEPMILPEGQSYNVNYGSKAYEETMRKWDGWRFTEWNINSSFSGAYLYDFRYLQMTSSSGYQKIPMSPEAFRRILFACEVVEDETSQGLLTSTRVRATPITHSQIIDWFAGNPPQGLEVKSNIVSYRNSTSGIHYPLYTDSGANEGFMLREFLLEHFYDSRLDEGSRGQQIIANEMLMETGIAKIDYDKRAEEILYGIEIRQITTKDKITGDTVASYEFEPTPRPIVTQPIKFFNEANRSGSGVEDAILGLVAEKTVEYRGRTFNSPSFIAWMDTNPHQKGNDLAFVDRIDMELYFGTLSLGSRFASLSERYGKNAKGTDPQFQIISHMLKSSDSRDYISPMRFADITKMWKIVSEIPFTSVGADEEDSGALLDISLISVLFTQRFMVKEKTQEIYGMEHTYSYDNDVYASPLVDISTTTNMQYESQHKDELEKFGTGRDNTKSQAPILIKRMLGFRFTNSLIKMTRALAFLRGKEFVTRQEVVDALPYCVGHRLGPAREGEDPKGRDIGIEREGMQLTNEQAFIRQLIVHGYLLRNTNSLLGAITPQTPSMFDIWDSFLNTCDTAIQSTTTFWEYEDKILLPLKTRVRQGGDITPVHWHIGTMVVDNEKRSNSQIRDGMSYKQRYNYYLEAITRPSALEAKGSIDSKHKIAAMVANHSAFEYYTVRGKIAKDPYLFSDDRARLLELCESKITAITGKPMKRASAQISSSSLAVAKKYSTEPRGGPSPTQFKWRTYGDALGVWGRLISNGANANIGIAELGAGSDLLDVTGVDLESNQEFSQYGTFEVTGVKGGHGGIQDAPFFGAMSKIINVFQPYVFGSGVHLGDLPPHGATSHFGPVDNISLEQYGMNAKDLMFRWLSGEAGISLNDGYMACFKLKHAFEGNINESIQGDDDLRLWLRLRVIHGSQNAGTNATFGLFVGVTSACMKPTSFDADDVPVEWVILDFNDAESYNPERYTTPAIWSSERFEDSGNLTRDDIQFFSRQLKTAIDENQG
jgi:hypothetical protein